MRASRPAVSCGTPEGVPRRSRRSTGMRIAISALVGMTVTLASTFARAQAAPPPSEVPPVPPSPGAIPVPEAPAAMPSPFPEGESTDDRVETAGWRDGFFIRDARDIVRFYPHLL